MTTNLPVTVTYSLEEILTRFEQNMNRQFTEVNQKIDKQFAEVNQRLTQLEIGQATLSGDIKALDQKFTGEIKTLDEKINGLDTKIDGISKRIDNQEIISRGVVIGLLVAVIGGLAKVFGWMPTN